MYTDIKNIADLLNAFSAQEQEQIKKENIVHAPTIGDMYEGLTKSLLSHETVMTLFPPELDLKVRSGFFYSDDNDNLSRQIDCMLVQGEGKQIPHTNEYKYNIKDVIAIFEVKKSLFQSQLEDSFGLLEEIDSFFNVSKSIPELNIKHINQSFSRITKKKAPHIDNLDTLNEHDYSVYQSLASDQLAPVRISMGYEGYKTEEGLRNGFIQYISKLKKFRVFKIPSLTISDNLVIIKTNGYPYYLTPRGDKWIVAASSNCNPLLFMLEVIFNKIEQKYNISLKLDEVIQNENTFPLLSLLKKNKKWEAFLFEAEIKSLNEREPYIDWEPISIDEDELLLLEKISKYDSISHDDILYLKSHSDKSEALLNKLIDSGYLVHKSDGLSQISSFCITSNPTKNYLLFPNKRKCEIWLESRNIAPNKQPE